MITGDLQNTEPLKIEYQRTDRQMRPETVFLPPKNRKFPFQIIWINSLSWITPRFSALYYPKSEKTNLQSA